MVALVGSAEAVVRSLEPVRLVVVAFDDTFFVIVHPSSVGTAYVVVATLGAVTTGAAAASASVR